MTHGLPIRQLEQIRFFFLGSFQNRGFDGSTASMEEMVVVRDLVVLHCTDNIFVRQLGEVVTLAELFFQALLEDARHPARLGRVGTSRGHPP